MIVASLLLIALVNANGENNIVLNNAKEVLSNAFMPLRKRVESQSGIAAEALTAESRRHLQETATGYYVAHLFLDDECYEFANSTSYAQNSCIDDADTDTSYMLSCSHSTKVMILSSFQGLGCQGEGMTRDLVLDRNNCLNMGNGLHFAEFCKNHDPFEHKGGIITAQYTSAADCEEHVKPTVVVRSPLSTCHERADNSHSDRYLHCNSDMGYPGVKVQQYDHDSCERGTQYMKPTFVPLDEGTCEHFVSIGCGNKTFGARGEHKGPQGDEKPMFYSEQPCREATNNGETVCENHGFTSTECLAAGCCEWEGGECWSGVGVGCCST